MLFIVISPDAPLQLTVKAGKRDSLMVVNVGSWHRASLIICCSPQQHLLCAETRLPTVLVPLPSPERSPWLMRPSTAAVPVPAPGLMAAAAVEARAPRTTRAAPPPSSTLTGTSGCGRRCAAGRMLGTSGSPWSSSLHAQPMLLSISSPGECCRVGEGKGEISVVEGREIANEAGSAPCSVSPSR